MSFENIFFKFLPKLLTFAVTCILYVATAIAVPIGVIIMYFWWFVAINLIKLQNKNAEIVSGIANWYTYVDSTLQSCICSNLTCSGEPDIPRMKQRFLDRYAMKHPLLQKYISYKYGYAYWLDEENFNIDNHVLWRPDFRVSNAEEQAKVIDKIHAMPFGPKQSPWRFVIYPHHPNYQTYKGNPTYTIQYMFNHAIGDGHSMTQALYNAVSDEQVDLPEPRRASIPLWYNVLIYLQSIPYYPIIAIELLTHAWNVFRDKTMDEKICAMSSDFPVATIQRIKNATKTQFVNVLQSCIVGAMGKYFQRHKLPMPPSVHIGIAYVLRNSNKEQLHLDNNYYCHPIEFPLTPYGSARERLLCVGKATTSAYNIALMKITGVFFSYMVRVVPRVLGRYLANNLSSTILLATSGAFTNNTAIFNNGNKLHSFSVRLCLNKKQGIALAFYTQGKVIDVTLNISPVLVKGQEEANLFLEDMKDELKMLEISSQ